MGTKREFIERDGNASKIRMCDRSWDMNHDMINVLFSETHPHFETQGGGVRTHGQQEERISNEIEWSHNKE